MSEQAEESLCYVLELSGDSSNNDISVNNSSTFDSQSHGSPSRKNDDSLNIAFTPKRTTLKKESMLLLQKKFDNKYEDRDDNAENVPMSRKDLNNSDSNVSDALQRISLIKTPSKVKSSIPVLTPGFNTSKQLKGLQNNDSARNSTSKSVTLSPPANDIDPSPTASTKIKRLQPPQSNSVGHTDLKTSRIPVSASKQRRVKKGNVTVSFASHKDAVILDTRPPLTPHASTQKSDKRISQAGTTPYRQENIQIYEDSSGQKLPESETRLQGSVGTEKNNLETRLDEQFTKSSSPAVEKSEMHLSSLGRGDSQLFNDMEKAQTDISPTTELNKLLTQLNSEALTPHSNTKSDNAAVVLPTTGETNQNPIDDALTYPSSTMSTIEALLIGQQNSSSARCQRSPDSDIDRLTRNSTQKESPIFAFAKQLESSLTADVKPVNLCSETPNSGAVEKTVEHCHSNLSIAKSCAGSIGEVKVSRRSDRSPAPQPSHTTPPRMSTSDRRVIDKTRDQSQNATPSSSRELNSNISAQDGYGCRIGSPQMQIGLKNQMKVLGHRRPIQPVDSKKRFPDDGSDGDKILHQSFRASFDNEQRNFNLKVYGVYDYEKENDEKLDLHSSPHRSGIGVDVVGNSNYISDDAMPTVQHSYGCEGLSLRCPGLRRHQVPHTFAPNPVEEVPFLMSSCEFNNQGANSSDAKVTGDDVNKSCKIEQYKYDKEKNFDEVSVKPVKTYLEVSSEDVVCYDDSSVSSGPIDFALSDLLGTPHVCPPMQKREDGASKIKEKSANLGDLEALRIPINQNGSSDDDESGIDDQSSHINDLDISKGSNFLVAHDSTFSDIEADVVACDRSNSTHPTEEFKEEYSDISMDCSALTFDQPMNKTPLPVPHKRRRKSSRKRSSKENALVQMSKTKLAQKGEVCPAADIKEVTMQGYVNKTTCASLTFGNKKQKSMKLSAVAILVRVDDIHDGSIIPKKIKSAGDEDKSRSCSPLKNEQEEAFSLAPNTSVIVQPGEEMKIRISFKPSRVAIYSGVIKIKCGSKSYVVLLRGEAVHADCHHGEKGSMALGRASSSLDKIGFRDPNKLQEWNCDAVSESHPEIVSVTEADSEHNDEDSVCMQQKWVKHWIDKELSRSARREIRYKSNPSTGEKQYLSKYEEWIESPGSGITSLHFSSEKTHYVKSTENYRLLDKLHISPTTLLVDNNIDTTNGTKSKITVTNSTNYPRHVRIEASSSLRLAIDCKAAGELNDIEIPPNTSLRVGLEIREEYMSALQQGLKSDIGEVHWGYVIIRCRDNAQETVCDVRSVDSIPEESTRLGVEDANFNEQVLVKDCSRTTTQFSSESCFQGSLPHSLGVYFAKDKLDFGSVAVGSLKRMKAVLCNATDSEVVVFIKDPELPFIVSHNEIKMQPRSYIRLPARMVPISPNQRYTSSFEAKSACGKYSCSIAIYGDTLM